MSEPEPPPRRPLAKRHVERLIAAYDEDPERALTEALRVVLGHPDLGFDGLVERAGLPPQRAARLRARRVDALDELARELNESRTLPASAP